MKSFIKKDRISSIKMQQEGVVVNTFLKQTCFETKEEKAQC